jgi:hypothetical protein
MEAVQNYIRADEGTYISRDDVCEENIYYVIAIGGELLATTASEEYPC